MGACRAAAVALVALMMAVCLVPCADAVEAEEYVIDMRPGDVFTYEPKTNLESTMSLKEEIDGVTFDGKTMTATFTEGGLLRQAVIVAVWTDPDGSGISQSAIQGITFRTYAHAEIAGGDDQVAAAEVGTKAGDVVYKPDLAEATKGTTTTVSCSLEDNEHVEWDPEQNAVIASRDIVAADAAELVFEITATNTIDDAESNLKPETVTVSVTVAVGSALAITSGSSMETFVGAGADLNTYTLTTNYDGDPTATVTKTFETDAPAGFIASSEDGVLTIDPSALELNGEHSRTVTVTATATATVEGSEEPSTATRQIAVTVWATEAFLNMPTIEDVSVTRTDDGVMVTATFGKCEVASIDWGDMSSNRIPDAALGTSSSVEHSYLASGKYVITLTALSARGDTATHYVLYDATAGTILDPYEPSDDETEERTYWWVVPLAVGLVLLAIFVHPYRDLRIGIPGALLIAVAAVMCFLGVRGRGDWRWSS